MGQKFVCWHSTFVKTSAVVKTMADRMADKTAGQATREGRMRKIFIFLAGQSCRLLLTLISKGR
jgi:hypothetical protein